LLILGISLAIISCNEQDKPVQEPEEESVNMAHGDYESSVLPSIVGYFNEVKGGISRLISYEAKSDSKSKYLAVILETSNADIISVNFHYEGQYNQSELSMSHPFIVICESDENCNNCGFKETAEGTICACNEQNNENPCMLSIDHVTDFDFYDNYHELGKELIPNLSY
jgi:hypothetical protein